MKRTIIIFLLLAADVGGWYAWKILNAEQSGSAPVFHGNVDIREVRLGFRVAGRVAGPSDLPACSSGSSPFHVAISLAPACRSTTLTTLSIGSCTP